METTDLIPVDLFCEHHQVEMSFIYSLQQHGLIETILIEEKQCISADELQKLEKMTRLYYDLDINIEGIETVFHLLEKIENLQNEIRYIKNI